MPHFRCSLRRLEDTGGQNGAHGTEATRQDDQRCRFCKESDYGWNKAQAGKVGIQEKEVNETRLNCRPTSIPSLLPGIKAHLRRRAAPDRPLGRALCTLSLQEPRPMYLAPLIAQLHCGSPTRRSGAALRRARGGDVADRRVGNLPTLRPHMGRLPTARPIRRSWLTPSHLHARRDGRKTGRRPEEDAATPCFGAD